jgi:hypothetical protein
VELKISCCKHQFNGVIAQNKISNSRRNDHLKVYVNLHHKQALGINKPYGQPIKTIEVHILVSRTIYSTLQLQTSQNFWGQGKEGSNDPYLFLFLLSVKLILATLTFKLESLTESSSQFPFTTLKTFYLQNTSSSLVLHKSIIHHKGELLKQNCIYLWKLCLSTKVTCWSGLAYIFGNFENFNRHIALPMLNCFELGLVTKV